MSARLSIWSLFNMLNRHYNFCALQVPRQVSGVHQEGPPALTQPAGRAAAARRRARRRQEAVEDHLRQNCSQSQRCCRLAVPETQRSF